ncbi:MAG TPA: hypothetical protein VN670_09245 [Acidobacteriaceae bacterium]|nr:hypothetical protein [Acidobacteriaceae bacterium]
MPFEPHYEACREAGPLQPGNNSPARYGFPILHRTGSAGFSLKDFFSFGMAAGLCFLGMLASTASAQTPQNKTSPPSTAPQPAVHHSTRHHRHAKPAAPAVVTPVVPPPPLPPPPPAQQTPQPATVSFNHGVLRVQANNASLVQTLNQISEMTGLAIQGLNHDQRIYGQYGPGPMVDIVTKLLDGSGYDYVIVGAGEHKAAKLILTPAGTSGAAINTPTPPPAQVNPPPAENEENPETTDPTEPPQAKTPQEIFDELRRAHPQR